MLFSEDPRRSSMYLESTSGSLSANGPSIKGSSSMDRLNMIDTNGSSPKVMRLFLVCIYTYTVILLLNAPPPPPPIKRGVYSKHSKVVINAPLE